MKRTPRYVPEFQVAKRRTRAGFVTSFEREEPELWTIWARSHNGEDRRATTHDLRRAGFKRRR